MSRIIGIGETVLDILFKNDQPQAAIPGGSTFNSIISLGRAGMDAAIVTTTGDDHIADITCRYLQDNGVSCDYVRRQQGSRSHISLAFLNERNDANYLFYKEHAGLRLEPAPIAFQSADAVLFGSFFAINPAIRSVTYALLSQAHEAGAFCYYDINFRRPHLADLPQVYPSILENMQLASIVRGSTEDFSILFGPDNSASADLHLDCLHPASADLHLDFLHPDTTVVEASVDRLYDQIIRHYCPYFICSSGAGAIFLRTPQHRMRFEVKPIPTVSTVGAGDNFNAGFLYALQTNHLSRLSTPLSNHSSHHSSNTLSNTLSTLSSSDWAALIAMGQRFAQDVCMHYENSISSSLSTELKEMR